MGDPKKTQGPTVKILVEGLDGEPNFAYFEWMAMANGGYIVRARIHDPYLNFLDKIAKILLQKARSDKVEVKFKIKWVDGDETEEIKAWVVDVTVPQGNAAYAETEIIAIDPPSWALNAGQSLGKMYKGNVTSVIRQVIDDHKFGGAPNLQKITETKDDKNNQWWIMRQDPKTFIQMLLDWSSSVTPQKTNWVTNCKNYDMNIVEQADLPDKNFGTYKVNIENWGAATDVNSSSGFTLQSDTLLSLWQTELHTQGLSAVSGKYYDRITSKDDVIVKDENTGAKINSSCKSEESFQKPGQKWSTSLLGIPEHNAGDVGIKYGKYVDGKSRNMYISQLNLMHRICVSVRGDAKVTDPLGLDGTSCNFLWINEKGQNYWLGGKWIVYGFHHKVSRENWTTDLYCRRYDYNAAAQKR
jgi:hypothetical protein